MHKVFFGRQVARRPDEVCALALEELRLQPGGDGGDVASPGLTGGRSGELLGARVGPVIAPADVDACFRMVLIFKGKVGKLERERSQRQLDERAWLAACFASPLGKRLPGSDVLFLQPNHAQHRASCHRANEMLKVPRRERHTERERFFLSFDLRAARKRPATSVSISSIHRLLTSGDVRHRSSIHFLAKGKEQ